MVAGEKATDIRQGWAAAQESIDSGKALRALEKLIEGTN
jgi:anthranilate phosphoribosyltransferase